MQISLKHIYVILTVNIYFVSCWFSKYFPIRETACSRCPDDEMFRELELDEVHGHGARCVKSHTHTEKNHLHVFTECFNIQKPQVYRIQVVWLPYLSE